MKDRIGERLVDAGLVASVYRLDCDRCLQAPANMRVGWPWELPSRLFKFPIEVSDAAPRRRIGLLHPRLRTHPFVEHVTTVIGVRPLTRGAPNAYGYTRSNVGVWWHAVDLVCSGNWRELLATTEFTSRDAILQAVAFGLSCVARFTVADARAVLRGIGCLEPRDRHGLIRQIMRPSSVKAEKRAFLAWPVNIAGGVSPRQAAWAHVFGLEDGWFARDRSGHIGWTKVGRAWFLASATRTAVAETWVQPSLFDIGLIEASPDTAAILGPLATSPRSTTL